MRKKTEGLNRLFLSAAISLDEYQTQAERLLCKLDWQKRIQFDNMLYM